MAPNHAINTGSKKRSLLRRATFCCRLRRTLAFGSTVGHFYFDETIQERGGFIIGAFVNAPNDVTPKIYSAIEQVGIRPRVNEFKSGARMDRNPKQAELRSHIMETLRKTRIGIIVAPVEERALLGHHALLGLRKILSANGLAHKPHSVFFDEGIALDRDSNNDLLGEVGALCEVHQSQDSKLVGGIQLADLAAHFLGGMLLENLGLLTKMVRAGENSGYDPDLEIELGFELWASLRYQLFKAPQPYRATPDDPVGNLVFDVDNYGLHISDNCSKPLREAALKCFGSCYLGCIH